MCIYKLYINIYAYIHDTCIYIYINTILLGAKLK